MKTYTAVEVRQILDAYRQNILCVGNHSTQHLKKWWEKRSQFVEVEIVESERGWGQKVDAIKQFKTRKLAEGFVKKYNAENNKKIVPDWYMYARIKE